MPRYFFDFRNSSATRALKHDGLAPTYYDAYGNDWNLMAAKSSHAAENLQTLIEIQSEVIRCRRLAEGLDDRDTARRLYAVADEIEAVARQVDWPAE